MSVVFSGTYRQVGSFDENGKPTSAAGTVALTPLGGSTTTATLDADGHYRATLTTVTGPTRITVVETLTGASARTTYRVVTTGESVDTSWEFHPSSAVDSLPELVAALAAKQDAIPSGTYVPITGAATVAGAKTFTGGVIVKADAVYDVRAYTGYDPIAADNSAAVQAAVTAAAASIGAVGQLAVAEVLLPPGAATGVTGITMPGQVHLTGKGSRLSAVGAGPMLTMTGNHNRVTQVQVQGGGAGVGANGILIASGARWNVIDFCRFDGMSGRAILFAAGSISNEAKSIFAQNCLLTTAGLAANTGVVEMAGTDNWFHHSEITASRSSLSSVNAYADALVIIGANSFVEDVQAEISDLGVYINATDLHMMNVRADLNRGHGFYIAGGSGTIIGCEALNNGQETDDTYDGFRSDAGNFFIGGCMAVSNVAKRHKFGLNDQQNSFSSANRVWGFTSIGQTGVGIFTPAFSGARVAVLSGPPYPVTVAATTFNIQYPGEPLNSFAMKNTTPVTFTNFTGGLGGQRISVFGDGFTTIPHGTNFYNASGHALLLAANTMTSYVMNNGVWYQDGGTAADFAPIDSAAAYPVTGEYVTPSRGSATTSTKSQDSAFWTWLPLAADATLDRIGIEVTSGVALCTFQFGLYAAGANGKPGALILDTGTGASLVDCSANGIALATISKAVTRPGVWLCAVRRSSASSTIRLAAGHDARYSRNSGTVVTGFNLNCWSATVAAGALPTPAPATIGDTLAPAIVVRFA